MWYDTIDLRALKSWRDGQLNLAHGTETKNYMESTLRQYKSPRKRFSRQYLVTLATLTILTTR